MHAWRKTIGDKTTASIILTTIDDDLGEKAANSHVALVLLFDHAVS
jgi:hypothetical protein